MQNRVSQALPRLPDVVRTLGVTTVKTSPDFMMGISLFSPDSRYDALYLRNYATLQLKDGLTRIPGVGQATVFGAGDYAMRQAMLALFFERYDLHGNMARCWIEFKLVEHRPSEHVG